MLRSDHTARATWTISAKIEKAKAIASAKLELHTCMARIYGITARAIMEKIEQELRKQIKLTEW